MNEPDKRLRQAFPSNSGDLAAMWQKTESGVLSGARPDRQLTSRATKITGVLVAAVVVAGIAYVGIRGVSFSSGAPDDDGVAVYPSEQTVEPTPDPSTEAPTPSPSVEPTPDPTPVVTHQCPAGAELPDGIDPRVCGDAPLDAVALDPLNWFVTPSNNIVCNLYGPEDRAFDGRNQDHLPYVLCNIYESSFLPADVPPRPVGELKEPQYCYDPADPTSSWAGSSPLLQQGVAQMGGYYCIGLETDPDVTHTTLEYGQTTVAGPIVCLSQSVGLTCWDQVTKHGFFLSQDSYSVW